MSTAALDIPLIAETICHRLSLSDIRTCQQVCRSWSTLFKPHPWRVTKLPSTASFTKGKIHAIVRSMPWIQSLKVAAVHVQKISHVGFSHLQELVLYDDNYGPRAYYGAPVNVDTILALIEKNTELKSLEIDLNRYNYRSHHLTPSLLLAIAKHPSLVKLTWTLPFKVASYNNHFRRALVYACHQGSIQELYVGRKATPAACRCCDENDDPFVDEFTSHSMDLVQDDSQEYSELRANIDAELPLVSLARPFAFKKLCLVYELGHFLIDLIRLSPELENVGVLLESESDCRTTDVLANCCPALRGLNAAHCIYDPALPNHIQRFSRLQKISFVCPPGPDFARVVSALAQSHLESLEVVATALHGDAVSDAIWIIRTFPHLRILDLGSLKIYVHDQESNHQEKAFLQSRVDRQSLNMVVREWTCPSTKTIQYSDMLSWWGSWGKAQQFMDSFEDRYVHRRGQRLRPVHMRFMYPLKQFMPVEVAMQYSNVVEDGPEGRRPMTVADAWRMALETRDSYLRDAGIYSDEPETQVEEETWGLDREYEMSKSRNRHHTLRDKKRSSFRRPFKK